MFLTPEVTMQSATRVGRRFASDHEPRIHLIPYGSLLDLVLRTNWELAHKRRRHRIDCRGFAWVVGDCRVNRESISAKVRLLSVAGAVVAGSGSASAAAAAAAGAGSR